MKTQGTKNWQNVAISAAVLLAFCLPMSGEAGVGGTGLKGFSNCLEVSTRPLSDFLDAQRTTSDFFPPVLDMSGWTDAPPSPVLPPLYFALVDYAGFANEYIEAETEISLGTKVRGKVIECKRDDGTSMISVKLHTKKALGFAQSIEALIAHGFDFLATPTIFGVKAQDVVVDGAEPALGPAVLRFTFVIPNHEGDLPAIIGAMQDNVPDVRPFTLDFKSTTVGTLPDGTRARMHIHQAGAAEKDGELIYTREIVDINKD